MKKTSSHKLRKWWVCGTCRLSFLLALILTCLLPPSQGRAADATNNAAASSQASPGGAVSPLPKPPVKKLTGAELYSMHCNRCHPERYPTERTAAQWKTILLHMRVRANLPAEQARTILKYLQENSGR
jgi:hypothetical protein